MKNKIPLDKAKAEKSPTIFMPIKQNANGKTAEAIVVKNENSSKKVAVKDVKVVEK